MLVIFTLNVYIVFSFVIMFKYFFVSFFKAFNYWLDVPDKHMEYITEIIEMLHNASLL